MSDQVTRLAWAAFVGVACVVVLMNAGRVGNVASALQGVTLIPSLMGLTFSFSAMWARGRMNHAAQRCVGIDADHVSIQRVSTVAFAANKMIKAGGLIGLGLFIRNGKRRGHGSAQIITGCVVAAIASFFALGVFVATSILVLFATGSLTGAWLIASTIFLIYATTLSTVVGWALVQPERAQAPVLWIVRAKDAIWRRTPDPESATRTATATIEQLHQVREAIPAALLVLRHALLSKILGAAMLLAATHAAGHPLGIDTILVIYTGILLASLVSILPGGIGLIEAGAATMLISAGMSGSAAVVTVVVFRVVDLWVPIAIGFAMSRSELFRTETAEEPEPAPVEAAVPAGIQ